MSKAASGFFFFIGKLQVAAVGHSAQSQRHRRPPHFPITFKSHSRCPEATFIPLLATSLLNETEAVLGYEWTLQLASFVGVMVRPCTQLISVPIGKLLTHL